MFDLGFDSGYLKCGATAARKPLSVSCHSYLTLLFSSLLKSVVSCRHCFLSCYMSLRLYRHSPQNSTWSQFQGLCKNLGGRLSIT